MNEWKFRIQDWSEREQLPFKIIMQTLRLAIVGNLSGPNIFEVCEVLGNEITLVRLKKLYNHLK